MAITLSGDGIARANLAADIIDSTKLADDAVDTEHLADDAVGVAELSATGTASSTTFLRGDNSWQTAGSTSASDLTSGTLPDARFPTALPAIDGSALTNLVQQDPTTLSYVGLDSAAHHNIGSFAIDSRGRYRISVDIRLGYTTQSGFMRMYLGTSSGGGKIGNARMVSENMIGTGVNLGLTMQWVMDFGTSLSYPYTVYATVHNNSAGSSAIFAQSDYNGIPVVSCLKVADIATSTGMVQFGS